MCRYGCIYQWHKENRGGSDVFNHYFSSHQFNSKVYKIRNIHLLKGKNEVYYRIKYEKYVGKKRGGGGVRLIFS